MQLPSADSAGFHAEIAALWRGIQRNSVAAAMPAFFPEDAYAQVKTLGDPRGDWVIRLLLDYRLDIAAVHALVGADVDRAQLVEVQVPGSYAHWVDPGACYNAIGYYEVPNSRLVYREHGELRSVGIASMISWRGVWYVIHLGATFRVGNIGVLDHPSLGRGSSAPSSTC